VNGARRVGGPSGRPIVSAATTALPDMMGKVGHDNAGEAAMRIENSSSPRRLFVRTIGIDYSGAQTPIASLKGLRVYLAEHDAPPVGGSAAAEPSQILDAQGHRRMAGGAARRGCADAGRDRSRFLVPAALFRNASALARLAEFPR
jgi:hypothetical protein